MASIVYQRRKHVINLFVAQRFGTEHAGATAKTIQGYNVRHWSEEGLDFWAVSDLDGGRTGRVRPESLGSPALQSGPS